MSRRLPAGLLVPAALAGLFVALPLAGLLVHASWGTLAQDLTTPEVLDALRLSLVTSAGALGLSLVLGVPLALLLARARLPGLRLLRAAVTLPMVLPPVVGGVALLDAFGRLGLAGGPLYDLTGLRVAYTTLGAVLAEAFVAMPFLVVTVEAGLRQADPRLEEAAATLGARPWTRLRRVTLPLAAPSLAAGAALCWARALGEFGATITFAGSTQGATQTMPIAVYQELNSFHDGNAVALSLVMLAVSVAVLAGLRDRWLGGA